jgi:outer membrane protein OmpA-like peptidoglycan-associated protein
MKSKVISSILVSFLILSLVQGQSETYSIRLLKISTDKYDEFSPVYFRNGLVFCSNSSSSLFMNYITPDNKRLLKINYVDTANLDKLGKVRLFSKNLKSKFNDGPASLSKRGDTIYFSRNIKSSGSVKENSNPRNKLGIFSAVLEENKWVRIRDLRFNNEYYNITTPYISPDGKRLFFASDNPAGSGGSDIYYCQWKGDYWDEPVNLGPEINTSGNESYPFINSEGGLFFSSDGHPGLGGKDIFYTKESGGKWQTPLRLDEPVNSQYDDFALITDSVMGEGYFSSKRGNTVDIYHFKTNIHQLFYCDKQRTNQYCFKFTDPGTIQIDDRFFQLAWSFGDGEKTIGQNVEHCFPGSGKYTVRLDVIDKSSGKVFFQKSLYNVELKDIEQPVINSPLSVMAGDPIKIDGLSSAFPDSRILNYTWNLGDGTRTEGESISHSFNDKGDYDLKLGLIVRDEKTGKIHNACAVKQIKVFKSKQDKSAYDSRPAKSEPRLNIFDYDHAFVETKYSAEKDYNQDMVFQVEILSSKMRLDLANKAFANVPQNYSIKEIFIPAERVYSYVVDEEMNLMATRPSFIEMTGLGFNNTRIRTFVLEDPAAKELNNLKKAFGVSSDTFFRKNEAGLTSSGTQVLDLILGFLTKYPAVKLEISNHIDNMGASSSAQILTQKRAEAMTNYLILNGVSPLRLKAAGYGSGRPVAPNFSEADRKLNRRVDFVIIK